MTTPPAAIEQMTIMVKANEVEIFLFIIIFAFKPQPLIYYILTILFFAINGRGRN